MLFALMMTTLIWLLLQIKALPRSLISQTVLQKSLGFGWAMHLHLAVVLDTTIRKWVLLHAADGSRLNVISEKLVSTVRPLTLPLLVWVTWQVTYSVTVCCYQSIRD